MALQPIITLSARLVAAFLSITTLACVSSGAVAPRPGGDFGVLVMAHGGTEEWNAEVRDAVASVERRYPVEIAFGMAAADSLQEAVARLEARGARRIGVVRLFVSGESWREETRQILGLSAGAPDAARSSEAHPSHGHSMGFWRIETSSTFAMTREGLSDAPEMGRVLAARARALSEEPGRESVLVLAHGPADDAENRRWIAAISERTEEIRKELPFRRVAVMTLREDWEEKRVEAEEGIRRFVDEAGRDGGRCLVIPFRVFGFGPYAEILGDGPYVADGRGLLPHPLVGEWIERQAEQLEGGAFEPTVTDRIAAGHP
jgi:sirohydrochlorin ferrochelatase